jgi:hypothetical protein
MDDELTPEQRFAAEDAEAMVPRALLQGRSPEDIVAELLRLDWSPAAAQSLVARAAADVRLLRESPEWRRRLLEHARRQFATGALLALLGAGITAFTLLAALTGAVPYYVVAAGLFFGGLMLLSRGWTRWRFYHHLDALPAREVEQGNGQAAGPGAAEDRQRE